MAALGKERPTNRKIQPGNHSSKRRSLYILLHVAMLFAATVAAQAEDQASSNSYCSGEGTCSQGEKPATAADNFSWSNPLQFFNTDGTDDEAWSLGSLQDKHAEEEDPVKDTNLFDDIQAFLASLQSGEVGRTVSPEQMLSNLLNDLSGKASAFQEMLDLFMETGKTSLDQLAKTFDGYKLHKFEPLQAYFYMLDEEARKDPVWKRHQHRFMPKVPLEQCLGLSDGLYLSQLAYADSCDDIAEGISNFHDSSWALSNCTVDGFPTRPAHFLMVRKRPFREQKKDGDNFWQRVLTGIRPNREEIKVDGSNPSANADEKVLEIVLAVRGTKRLGDMLSDGMLHPVDYRGGKAHEGMSKSAAWLARTYKDYLMDLLVQTGLPVAKVWLVGHSLGGGTAALTTLELIREQQTDGQDPNQPHLEPFSVGFGTPAVVSKELSEQLAGRVTTVVHDNDAVPRMSGALLVNAWLRIATYNLTKSAYEHLDMIIPAIKDKTWEFAHGAVDDFGSFLRTKLAQNMDEALLDRIEKDDNEQVLMPPGDCIHIYRDGTGWEGVFMDCDRFNEMDVVLNFIDDHMIPTGYYPGLLSYIRELKSDLNWRFEPDLMDLPIQ